MNDIVNYHLIKIVPECFLGVSRGCRMGAIEALQGRQFAHTDHAFWRTLGVLGRYNVSMARAFVARQGALLMQQIDADDRKLLTVYDGSNERYMVRQLLSIHGDCGVEKLPLTSYYLFLTFSVWYAHEITIRRTLVDTRDLIEITLRHFPKIIPGYLNAMSNLHGGGWPLQHDIMTLSMEAIEQRYPRLIYAGVFRRIKARITADQKLAHENATSLFKRLLG
ncbi:hypothetical protein D5b_00486 [Faustovirus]|nr:hypothetical protein D5b_00486 [Faustovirus]